jgi:BirA family biotin operon repressor/biotin-[acetyl-CoA-carboxylase] ligase
MSRSNDSPTSVEFPRSLLTARRIGAQIDRHAAVDSTNQQAFDAAAAGAPDGTVIIADAQRAGRGRQGRRWESPAGSNLYLSILLRGPFLPPIVTGLPFLAALAARDAIHETTGLTTQFKWPNDLMINGRKAGGILLEARSAGGRTALVVVGIGINANWPRAVMPEELKTTATSLEQELGRPVDRTGLLAALMNRFDAGYNRLNEQGVAWVMDDWSRSCVTLGRRVSVESATGPLTGIAEAVEPGGHLRLRHADGSISRLSVEATIRLRTADDHTPIPGGRHHAVRD